MARLSGACATTMVVITVLTPWTGVAGQASGRTTSSARVRSANDQVLRTRVAPKFAMEPASVIIEAVVEPADRNRSLEFVVDSGEFYRSSTIELSGAHASRTHRVEFRSLPSGTYAIRVALKDGGERVRAVVAQELTVVGIERRGR